MKGKGIAAALAASVAATAFIGCAGEQKEAKYKMYMPDGAPAVALAGLMYDGYDDMSFTVVPNEAKLTIVQHVARGDADFAILPVNAAATLYNNKTDIVMLSVNTHGNLYVIGDGGKIALSDLAGKKLGVIGQSNVPEYTLKMILNNAGIGFTESASSAGESDVTLQYVGNGAQLAPLLNSGDVDYGFLAEPAVTTVMGMVSGSGVVLDIQTEWNEAFGSAFPMACLVAKRSVAESDGEYVSALLQALKSYDSWAEEHPDEAVEAVAACMEDGMATTLKKLSRDTVKRCNIKTVPAAEAESACSVYFNKLIELKSVLGNVISAVPDTALYYKGNK